MKLISCYIENFGNLHKQSINFNENITSFYKENGYGKSTLASFIKAMFYGMESYTKSTKSFVDRMHYYPFNKPLYQVLIHRATISLLLLFTLHRWFTLCKLLSSSRQIRLLGLSPQIYDLPVIQKKNCLNRQLNFNLFI